MAQRYDRRAIGARASAIYQEAKKTRRSSMTWPDAQRQAWAEAKGNHLPGVGKMVVSPGFKHVAMIDAQQPGGVAAAMARYGISIAPVVNFAASFAEHLTEVLHAAAVRRSANVAALEAGARVIDARRDERGAYRV